jgi:hypothetical protein
MGSYDNRQQLNAEAKMMYEVGWIFPLFKSMGAWLV